MKPAGYSGTPLSRKLGWKPGMRVLVIGEPEDYRLWLEPIPDGVRLLTSTTRPVQAAHLFATRRSLLERKLTGLRERLEPNGMIWVSWPKKSSGIASEITEDTIREVAFPLDLVDVKVCAVSEVWSGLKLVIRKEARPTS